MLGEGKEKGKGAGEVSVALRIKIDGYAKLQLETFHCEYARNVYLSTKVDQT